MVLGRDVGLLEVAYLSLCMLAGRFGYRALGRSDIGWWVDENWR